MKNFWIFLFNIFVYVVAGIVLYKILSPLFGALVLRGDTLSSLWWGKSDFVGVFSKNEHTCLILSMFLCVCGRYIPEFLKMHPFVWYIEHYQWILFAVLYLLQFAFLENFTKYFKQKAFVCLSMFLISPIFVFLLISASADWILTDDCWAFAYLFIPVFSVVFLSECENFYVKNSFEKVALSHKITLFLLFLCVAISFEVQRFVICVALLIMYFLHCIFVNKNFNHKKFWLSYFAVGLACIATLFLPENEHFLSRVQFVDIVSIFPQYLSIYFQNFIFGNKNLFLALILLVVVAIAFTDKKEERRKLFVFESSVLFSVLIFPLLLIFCSVYDTMLMVEHTGLILLAKIYLFSMVLSLCGWILSSAKLNSIKALTTICCFVPLISLFNLSKMDLYIVEQNQQFKKRMYILEKLFILYEKDNKIFLNCADYQSFVPVYSLMYFIYLYDKNADFDKYKQVDFCQKDEDNVLCDEKLINLLKEKTGYALSQEEIDRLDFQKNYLY